MTLLAFSTLGCPGLPLHAVAELAARHGFSGVELRVADGEPVQVGLNPAGRRAAVATLAAHGIRPLSVASYVRIAADGGGDEGIVTAGIAHGILAADLGAQYLRIFPGGPVGGTAAAGADPGRDTTAIRRLRAIRDGLAATGVSVAVETHDSHPRGADIARLLDGTDGVGAIWDVLHPWRAGESAAATVTALRGRMAYVQVKDVVSAADLTPLAPGAGVLPLAAVAEALRDAGFDGWVSWEYERAWFPHMPDFGSLAGRVARWMRAEFGPT